MRSTNTQRPAARVTSVWSLDRLVDEFHRLHYVEKPRQASAALRVLDAQIWATAIRRQCSYEEVDRLVAERAQVKEYCR